MGKIRDITGEKFHKLTAITFLRIDLKRKAVWLFQCDCGNSHEARMSAVVNGRIKSCGCNRKWHFYDQTTHGLSRSRVYRIHALMLQRCNDPTVEAFKYYGARGIKVCNRWLMFENFYADMGHPPSDKHTLDRINNNGDYCKENCKWATRKEQTRNRRNSIRVEYDCRVMCLSELCEMLGMKYDLVRQKYRRGYSISTIIPGAKLIST